MVAQEEILTRGGIYLARLDPTKGAEVGKIRPVVIFTSQALLDIGSPILFACPLSSQSHPTFRSLHVTLPPRDNLEVTSYAISRALSLNQRAACLFFLD